MKTTIFAQTLICLPDIVADPSDIDGLSVRRALVGVYCPAIITFQNALNLFAILNRKGIEFIYQWM